MHLQVEIRPLMRETTPDSGNDSPGASLLV
jgi:hypothetical protein